jgi:hypothetical protein
MADIDHSKDNEDTFYEGMHQLAVGMAKMSHDALKGYIEEMEVTYTAEMSAEWVAVLTLEFLKNVADEHKKHHGEACVVLETDPVCFCGVIDRNLHRRGCPIARYVHADATPVPTNDKPLDVQ